MTTISGKYEDRIFGRTVVAQMVQLKQNFVQLKKFGETEKDEVLQLKHEVYNWKTIYNQKSETWGTAETWSITETQGTTETLGTNEP